MKTIFYLASLLWLFVFTPLNVKSQIRNRVIAKVKAWDKAEGSISEAVSAGIIFDWVKSDRKVYIAVAAHGIRPIPEGARLDTIEVQFFGSQTKYPAKTEKFAEDYELDLAVISVRIPQDENPEFIEVEKVPIGYPRFNQEIMLVGHPYDNSWSNNPRNPVTETSYNKFTIKSGNSVHPGYSGGGAFDVDSRLAGMTLKVGNNGATIMHISILEFELNKMNFKTRLIKEPKPELGWLYYTAPGGGLVLTSLAFYSQFQDLEAEYKRLETEIYYPNTVVDPSAPDLHEDSQLYMESVKKAQNKARQTMVAGVAGGVLMTVGTIKLATEIQKRLKRRKAEGNYRAESGRVDFYPYAFTAGSQTQLGIAIKF